MLQRITAKFETADSADMAAARIKTAIGLSVAIHGSYAPGNNDASAAELDMLIVPFPASNFSNIGAAFFNAAAPEAAAPASAELTVTAQSEQINEIRAIMLSSGGYSISVRTVAL